MPVNGRWWTLNKMNTLQFFWTKKTHNLIILRILWFGQGLNISMRHPRSIQKYLRLIKYLISGRRCSWWGHWFCIIWIFWNNINKWVFSDRFWQLVLHPSERILVPKENVLVQEISRTVPFLLISSSSQKFRGQFLPYSFRPRPKISNLSGNEPERWTSQDNSTSPSVRCPVL